MRRRLTQSSPASSSGSRDRATTLSWISLTALINPKQPKQPDLGPRLRVSVDFSPVRLGSLQPEGSADWQLRASSPRQLPLEGKLPRSLVGSNLKPPRRFLEATPPLHLARTHHLHLEATKDLASTSLRLSQGSLGASLPLCSEAPSLKPTPTNLSSRSLARRPRSRCRAACSAADRAKVDSSEEQVSKQILPLQLGSSAAPQARLSQREAYSGNLSRPPLEACSVNNPSSHKDCSVLRPPLDPLPEVFSAVNRKPRRLCSAAKRATHLRVSKQASLEQSLLDKPQLLRAEGSLAAVEAQVVSLEPVPSRNPRRAVCLAVELSHREEVYSGRIQRSRLPERAAACSAELLLLPQEQAAASSGRAQPNQLKAASLARHKLSSRLKALVEEACLAPRPSLDRLNKFNLSKTRFSDSQLAP